MSADIKDLLALVGDEGCCSLGGNTVIGRVGWPKSPLRRQAASLDP